MRTDLPAQPAGTRSRAHADDHLHGAYIQAMEAEMASLGVHVTALRLHSGPVRHADLEVRTAHRAEPILVRWDEINGWSIQTRDAATDPAVFFGIAVVPPPIHLATWVYLTLEHLDVTLIRAGAPIMESNVDNQLRGYNKLR